MAEERSVFITGGNRGIGLSFVSEYLRLGWKVYASVRKSESLKIYKGNPNLEVIQMDLSNLESIHELDSLDHQFDLIINNAAVYGGKKQNLHDFDENIWLETCLINFIRPLLVTQKLIPKLKINGQKKIIFLSSKMGSITDNSSGGSLIYRSTKAALNQMVKSLSISLSSNGISVVAVHPGWVKTDMGGPQALISADDSVKSLIKTIASLGSEDSGSFVNYDGAHIPW
ncbi:MAG: SDR family oxidoreductase [Gammaproteobacteria bacterium]